MITIISGTPGSGKTALIVDMMMDEIRKGRKVFTIGIPKLLLGVHQGGDAHQWHDGTWLQIDKYDKDLCKQAGIKSTWFPRFCPDDCRYLHKCARLNADDLADEQRRIVADPFYPRTHFCDVPHAVPDAGALIVIDESHTDFPQRASGKAPPPWVEALTVHRHQGLDFWFVTQRPSFLDPFVRGLSSRHIHLALNSFSFTGKRIRYEWSEYQETVNRSSKLLASRADYKPSPAVFPLYASASLHTRLDQRMPTILKMAIFVAVLSVGLVGFGYSRVMARVDSVHAAQRPVVSSVSQPAGATGGGRSPQAGAAAGVPAPVVSAVPSLSISSAPLISSCVSSASRCQCYTVDGVKILLSEADCRSSALSVNDKFRFAAHVSESALLGGSSRSVSSANSDSSRWVVPSHIQVPASAND
jgi:zona occludens toxin